MQECSVPECTREKYFKSDLCSLHKHRVETTGDPYKTNHNLRQIGDTGEMTNEVSPICSIDGCERPYIARGWCAMHYKRWKSTGDPLQTNLTPRMIGNSGKTTKDYDVQICSIDDCGKPHASRGWCSMHYARWDRFGDPMISRAKEGFCSIIYPFRNGRYDQFLKELQDFIIRLRKPGIDSDCWEWQGPVQRGYAKTTKRIEGKNVAFYVHRMSLEAKLDRPLHPKMQAHHQCANAICVNPDHLEESTASENMGEMKARSYFLARIAELEAVVREINPAHAILIHELPFVS